MTSYDYMFKRLCEFINITTLPSLVAIDLDSSDSRDTAAKIVYVTLQDIENKGSADFMEENSSLYIPNLPKLITIDIVLMDIYLY